MRQRWLRGGWCGELRRTRSNPEDRRIERRRPRISAPCRQDPPRRQGSYVRWGKIELEQGPDALKDDTTSRGKHLQAVLSQSGSPYPHPDGRFDIQPAVPVRRLIPSRSRPSWRDSGHSGETTFQIGIHRVAVSVSRSLSRESGPTDRPSERRSALQSNVSRRRPGYARDKPPYPSLERRIAIQPVRSAR